MPERTAKSEARAQGTGMGKLKKALFMVAVAMTILIAGMFVSQEDAQAGTWYTTDGYTSSGTYVGYTTSGTRTSKTLYSASTVGASVYGSNYFAAEYSNAFIKLNGIDEEKCGSGITWGDDEGSVGQKYRKLNRFGNLSLNVTDAGVPLVTATSYSSTSYVYFPDAAFIDGEWYDVKMYMYLSNCSGSNAFACLTGYGSIGLYDGDSGNGYGTLNMYLHFLDSDGEEVPFSGVLCFSELDEDEGFQLARYTGTPTFYVYEEGTTLLPLYGATYGYIGTSSNNDLQGTSYYSELADYMNAFWVTVKSNAGDGDTNTGGLGIRYYSNESLLGYFGWSSYNTVIYDANGGTENTEYDKNIVYNSTGDQTNQYVIQYGRWETQSGDIFSRSGYKFVGWSTNKNRTASAFNNSRTTDYSPGDTSTISSSGDTITLYAVWEECPEITLKKVSTTAGGNTVNSSDTNEYVIYARFEGMESGTEVTATTNKSELKTTNSSDSISGNSNTWTADSSGAFERSFIVRAGETITFSGVPLGSTYYFREYGSLTANSTTYTNNKVASYTIKNGSTTIGTGSNSAYQTSLTTDTVTQTSGDDVTVTFTNKGGSYYVFYYPNGGSVNSDYDYYSTYQSSYARYRQSVTYGAGWTSYGSDAYTRDGYAFVGWSEDPDRDPDDFDPSENTTEGERDFAADTDQETFLETGALVLYAVWEEAPTITLTKESLTASNEEDTSDSTYYGIYFYVSGLESGDRITVTTDGSALRTTNSSDSCNTTTTTTCSWYASSSGTVSRTFVLLGGETLTIEGVPVGAEYYFSERASVTYDSTTYANSKIASYTVYNDGTTVASRSNSAAQTALNMSSKEDTVTSASGDAVEVVFTNTEIRYFQVAYHSNDDYDETYSTSRSTSLSHTVKDFDDDELGFTYTDDIVSWNKSANGAGVEKKVGSTITLNQSSSTSVLTWDSSTSTWVYHLYAIRSDLIPGTLTFHAEGGAFEDETEENAISYLYAQSGGSAKQSTGSYEEPTRYGYTFVGWADLNSDNEADSDNVYYEPESDDFDTLSKIESLIPTIEEHTYTAGGSGFSGEFTGTAISLPDVKEKLSGVKGASYQWYYTGTLGSSSGFSGTKWCGSTYVSGTYSYEDYELEDWETTDVEDGSDILSGSTSNTLSYQSDGTANYCLPTGTYYCEITLTLSSGDTVTIRTATLEVSTTVKNSAYSINIFTTIDQDLYAVWEETPVIKVSKVSQTVTGATDKSDDNYYGVYAYFKFEESRSYRITVSTSGDNLLYSSSNTCSSSSDYTSYTFTGTAGTYSKYFIIKAGETLTFEGVPVDAQYYFREQASVKVDGTTYYNNKVVSYTISDANGGTSINSSSGANTSYRTTLSTYTTNDEGNKVYETNDSGEDVTVTFINRGGTKSIYYYANGGTVNTGYTYYKSTYSSPRYVQSVYYGQTWTTYGSNAYTRDGYDFVGWSKTSTRKASAWSTSTYSGYDYAASASQDAYLSKTNTYLYAIWKAKTYTVTYHSNYPDGTDKTISYEVTYGDDWEVEATSLFEVPGDNYVWSTDYTNMWTTTADATDEDCETYTAGDVDEWDSTETIDLYAQWEEQPVITVSKTSENTDGSTDEDDDSYYGIYADFTNLGTGYTITASTDGDALRVQNSNNSDTVMSEVSEKTYTWTSETNSQFYMYFVVKAGETITIEGVPLGTEYYFTEQSLIYVNGTAYYNNKIASVSIGDTTTKNDTYRTALQTDTITSSAGDAVTVNFTNTTSSAYKVYYYPNGGEVNKGSGYTYSENSPLSYNDSEIVFDDIEQSVTFGSSWTTYGYYDSSNTETAAFVRDGYTLIGWSTDASTTVDDFDASTDEDYALNTGQDEWSLVGDLELYAVWSSNASVQILKKGSGDTVLEGAVFDIYDVSDLTAPYDVTDLTPVAEDLTTGSDGYTDAVGLGTGTYYYVETEAPDGYFLTNGTFTITDDQLGTDVVITVKDSVLSTLPSSGGAGFWAVIALSCCAVLTGGFCYQRRRKAA